VASHASARRSIEREFFRALNRVVEPLVRAGVGSPHLAPGGLIVLETRGRKTGRLRRTPLVATRVGGHVLVGTFRGDRSEWVRNLAARPRTRFWLGGRARDARAFVLYEGRRFRVPKTLPAPLRELARFAHGYTRMGWAFAILAPAAAERPR
jgi:deazaflavin-dependent oxidoreductase (nitroreductase family)